MTPRYLRDITVDLPPGAVQLQPKAAEEFKQRVDNCQRDSPLLRCLPVGVPRLNAYAFPYKVVNVWTAARAASERQPVIVWAHGGSFMVGAGSLPEYDGEAVARHGVVVTVNYRLGPFGFFAHPELTRESPAKTSGNSGLMDFVAALEWVQRNIAGFGGDPSNVTIVGQSAGGYLVQYAIRSSRVGRLFRRAVIQSAPVRIFPVAALAEAERAGQDAAMSLGAPSIAVLRAKPAAELLKGLPAPRPIIDGWIVAEDEWTSARAGRVKPVDLLVGSNKDEGTFPYLRGRELGLGPMSSAEFTAYVRTRFGPGADAFLELYPAKTDAETAASQLPAFADEAAWNARFHAAAAARAGARSYLYSFTHEPPVAVGTINRRATHTAEIPYVFNIPGPLWTELDRRLAQAMSAYWANFAKTGNPNGPGLRSWPAFAPGKGEELMVLGSHAGAAPALDSARVRLFDALLERLIPDSERRAR